jgi:Tfp pilus assembly protein PilF
MLSSNWMFRVIHREVVQLAILIAVAAGAFSLTRTVAASNRAMSVRDAAEWYQLGERALQQGRTADAIASLRRAVMRDRADTQYVLALARALARAHDYDAARSVLLDLREGAPEDPYVNLALGRLAVERRDVSEALRYYHSAVLAHWPGPDGDDARRAAREELIRFLLDEHHSNLALSEILALAADLPDTAEARVNAARLFFEAGDTRRAREQYARALQIDPRNAEARHAVRALRSVDSTPDRDGTGH